MLIRRRELEAIRSGEMTLAFRRWPQRRVLPGTALRTAIGVVSVSDVEAVEVDEISGADSAAAGYASRDELVSFLERRAGTIYRIRLRHAGPDPRVALREQAQLTAEQVGALRIRLARLDRAAGGSAWTRSYLELIEARPATLASTLADSLGIETARFKRRVRQLKELGLTISLRPGYRLSPRGEALLAALRAGAKGA